MVAGLSYFQAGVHSRVARSSSGLEEINVVVGQNSPEMSVTVSGRVTIDSSPHLRSPLLQAVKNTRAAVVLIEMAGVTYLDVSGIVTLLEALTLARQSSVKLRLQGLSGQPRMLAEITELATIFAFADSEAVFS